jgi:hypothetical protein
MATQQQWLFAAGRKRDLNAFALPDGVARKSDGLLNSAQREAGRPVRSIPAATLEGC